MFSPKVKEWEACELRYVAESKLNRLSDVDLKELERLLVARLGKEPSPTEANNDRGALISRIMVHKQALSLKRIAETETSAKRLLESETSAKRLLESEKESENESSEENDSMKERMSALIQLTAAATFPQARSALSGASTVPQEPSTFPSTFP